jgi:hypothetical protein
LIAIATLFFGLGTGLLLLPFDWVPRRLFVLGIGGDLVLLGLAIAILDTFQEGEALLPDISRSMVFSFFAVLLFGGQVVIVIALSTGITFPMLVLLMAVAVTAIFIQVFANPLQNSLDWFVFRRVPWVRKTRADLRVAASGAPRIRQTLDPASLTAEQFAQITRKALSQIGNLPRLSANPLTRLKIISVLLAEQGDEDSSLERAATLKTLLGESIARLKPRHQGDFGTSDEWRFYNALYYPYVAGLKPYRRRTIYHGLDLATREVLAWFQSQVPERTLCNWQTAAAKLVARDLRERAIN